MTTVLDFSDDPAYIIGDLPNVKAATGGSVPWVVTVAVIFGVVYLIRRYVK